jgi:aspartyl-tRNA(Asn)/glutamyl-tRNA(Gln) amidotransferase subunit C
MTKDEILHLGTLSRIALSPTEVETLSTQIDAILQYVSTVKDIVSDKAPEPNVGARYNVLRPDEITNKPGKYTERLLEALPQREGQYMLVKKILNQDE